MTEEQRQRLVEIGRQLPWAMGEEREQEILTRYAQGQTMDKIATDMAIGSATVYRILHRHGKARTKSEAGEVRWDTSVRNISPDRWREMYWAAGGGLPSIQMLADRFKCSGNTIRRYLRKAGIEVRDMSKQAKASFAVGRRRPAYNPRRSENLHLRARKKPATKQWMTYIRKLATEARHLNRIVITRPCSWCGVTLERTPCAATPKQWGCCRSHGALARRFFERAEPGAIRPLILDRLRELLSDHPYKAMSFDSALQKAGQTIGATDAEYDAIRLEWAQG